MSKASRAKSAAQRIATAQSPGGAMSAAPIEVPTLAEFTAAGMDPAGYESALAQLRAESVKSGRPLLDPGVKASQVRLETDELDDEGDDDETEETPAAAPTAPKSMVPGAGEKAPARSKSSGKFVLVKNATDSVQVLARAHPAGSSHGGHSHHTLVPGVNRIPAHVWENAKQLTTIGHQLDDGDLIELEVQSLGELKVKAALALVKETVDPRLLADWQKADDRAPVRRAITTQITKITPVREPDEDEDEGDTEP